jgi:hypothetical protein
VITGARQVRELAADQVEDLGLAEPGDEQADLARRRIEGGRGIAAHVAARAGPAFDHAVGHEIAQRACDRRS